MLGLGFGIQKLRHLGGLVGLLDTYPNAALAYSLRLLRKNYSGGLTRVRAWDGSANQGEADVMAYRISATEYLLDLNSTLENLDATAIGRGLTTSDTLADLVSTGVNDYDGFVSSLYDQSGNADDVAQATATAQPKIVDAGSLILENGKPALEFDGVNDSLNSDNPLNIGTNDVSMFIVFKNDGTTGDQSVFSSGHGNGYQWTRIRNSNWSFFLNSPLANYSISSSSFTPSTNYLLTELYSGSRSIWQAFANGSSIGSDVIAAQNLGTDIFNIGSLGGSSDFLEGTFREAVVYLDDKDSTRTNIEANINDFYSIYS